MPVFNPEPRPPAGERHRAQFLAEVLAGSAIKPLLSYDHFLIDGTMIGARASMKSFRPKDGSGEPSAPGRNGARRPRQDEEQRDALDPLCCATDHRSGRRLYKKAKGQPAKLRRPGHAVIENRSDPVVAACVTPGYRHRRAGGCRCHGRRARRGSAHHARCGRGL